MAWYNPMSWGEDEQDNSLADQFTVDDKGNLVPKPQQAAPPKPPIDQSAINAGNAAGQPLVQSKAQSPVQQSLTPQRVQDIAGMRAGLESYLQQPAQTNFAPIMGLIDHWTGSDLSKTYSQPMSPEERLAFVDKLQSSINKAETGLSANDLAYLQKGLTKEKVEVSKDIGEKRVGVLQQNADTNSAKVSDAAAGQWHPIPGVIGPNGHPVLVNNSTGEQREADTGAPIPKAPKPNAVANANGVTPADTKRLDNFYNDMDPTKNRGNKNISTLDMKVKTIDGIEQMVNSAGGPDNLTPQQIATFAEEVGKVMGAGASSEARIHALTPNFAGKGVAEWKQFLTGQAQSAGGGDLIKVLLNEMHSQKVASVDQIKKHQYDVVQKYDDLGKHPSPYVQQQFKAGMDQYGLDPKTDLKQGRYVSTLTPVDYEKQRPSNQLPAGPSSGTAVAAPAQITPDHDKAMVNWARQNPNDPRAAKILELNAETLDARK